MSDETPQVLPDFKGDKDREIAWLRVQLDRVVSLADFQTQRLRLRADFWEAHRELESLHAQESERLRSRVTELEMSLAGMMSAPTKVETVNRAWMVLGGVKAVSPGMKAPTPINFVESAVKYDPQPFPHGRFASKERGGV